MSTPTPGSEPSYPQEGTPAGQPGWTAPPPAQGYGAQNPQGYGAQNPQGYGAPDAQAYGAAPQYSGGYGAPAAQRPGMVTAAGIIGIVWGALGLLFGLLALTIAFALVPALGLIVLIATAVSAVLLWGGIQVMQNKSPRLLLLVSYVAIVVNLISMIWNAAEGNGFFSGLLGFVLPGIVVALLLNQQSKQYYASQGISY